MATTLHDIIENVLKSKKEKTGEINEKTERLKKKSGEYNDECFIF